jgi:hypothetical protein
MRKFKAELYQTTYAWERAGKEGKGVFSVNVRERHERDGCCRHRPDVLRPDVQPDGGGSAHDMVHFHEPWGVMKVRSLQEHHKRTCTTLRPSNLAS